MNYADFPIYVIACEGENQRLKNAEDQVRRVFGRPPIYIRGAHRDRPDFQEFTGINPAHLTMKKGEAACVLAHQAALLDFLQGSAPYCLILEDDIHFCGEKEAFRDSFQELHENFTDWDWVWFRVPFEWDNDQPIPSGENPGKFVYHCTHLPVACSCYGISRKGAVELLKRSRGMTQPIDMLTQHNGRIYMGPQLSCIGDQGFGSIIHGTEKCPVPGIIEEAEK